MPDPRGNSTHSKRLRGDSDNIPHLALMKRRRPMTHDALQCQDGNCPVHHREMTESRALAQERERLKQQAEKSEEQAGYSKGKWPGIHKRGPVPVTTRCRELKRRRNQGRETKTDRMRRQAVLMEMHVHGEGVPRAYQYPKSSKCLHSRLWA